MCYTNKQYVNRLHKLEALQAQIAELEAQYDEVKQDIILSMDDDIVDGEGFTIKWTPYTSARFDSKRFKVEHPKQYEQYVVSKESRRFGWSWQ